jgi:hypothetical protein
MNDHRDRTDNDGELLSSWLAGELDDASSEDLERRLAREPALSERLDRVHDTLVALRGLDEVEPPAGMAERLNIRLRQERAPGVASLDAARERRARRTNWTPVVAAAAAVVALIAVVPVFLNRPIQTAGDAEVSAAAPEAAIEAESELLFDSEESGGAGSGVQEDAAGAAVDAPVIVESSSLAAAGGEAAQDLRAAPAPEAGALLGLPVAEARELARAYEETIRSAPPFPTLDVAPGACLDAVTAEIAVAVPVRVEGFVQDGSPTLAYMLVVASPASPTLDAVEVRVVDAAACTPS